MDDVTRRRVHAARAAWYMTATDKTPRASQGEAEAMAAALDAADDDAALLALFGAARWDTIRSGGVVGFYRRAMARARAAAATPTGEA